LPAALEAVSKMGFREADLIAIPNWGLVEPEKLVSSFDETVGDIRKCLNQYGLTAVAVNAGFPTPYVRDDAALNAARCAQVEAVCRMMQRLGIAVGSFFPGSNWPAQEMEWERVLDGEAATLREMLDTALSHGVTLAVELHANTPFETVEQGRRLLEAVPELKVAYDPSHFAMQGIPLAETVEFLDRTVHVHLRDAGPGKMQMAVGEGTVDFGWIVEQLRARSYEGTVSIEYLPGMAEEIAKLRERLRIVGADESPVP